jgi:murein DD-endopeptidase MepM/ murein hydrolase activator NlpD
VANEIVYVVQAGDTLSGIALKFKIPMSRLQERNNIQDIQSLQIGDQLVVPVAPTPTFTPGPAVSSSSAATPTPLAKYPPVKLLTPLDREIFIGNSAPILLQWLSSGILQPDELYLVEIERPGARSLSFHTLATSYHLSPDQFPAPDDPNRVFQWSVVIIRQTGTGSDGAPVYTHVSPYSSYGFEWLASPPTPTATPTLAPGQRPAVQPSATPTSSPDATSP